MVNLFAIQQQLSIYLLKLAGVQTQKVEIEPGTYMNFWVPNETIQKPNKKTKQTTTNPIKQNKPIVVLIHGFAADGIATWQFQIGGLLKEYSVYVPDLLFFGGSFTDSSDRSPRFQAECLVTALKKLGVERCVVVGFSYGGMVAFKMAELYPEMVRAMVISGSIIAMTDSFTQVTMKELGFSSLTEFLLPDSVKGLKTLFSVGTHKKLRFPSCLYKDYLQMMFNNRKERAELLEGLIVRTTEDISHITHFPQKIHLLWEVERSNNQDGTSSKHEKVTSDYRVSSSRIKLFPGQLGENTSVESISKAGHLVHIERPCVYTRCIKKFPCLPTRRR